MLSRVAVAKHFALSGAAMLIFGLFLSWPWAFSWHEVLASIVVLVSSGTGWRLIGFIVATVLVAVLLRPRFPEAAEWVGSLAVLAMLYPFFGLLAGLPPTSGWPGLFVSVGAICWATGGSIWILLATLRGSDGQPAPILSHFPSTTEATLTGGQLLLAAESGAAPTCPKCGAPMKQRVAKTGKNAGEIFWGCTRYPKCQTTQPT